MQTPDLHMFTNTVVDACLVGPVPAVVQMSCAEFL